MIKLQRDAYYTFSFILERAIFSDKKRLATYLKDLGFKEIEVTFDVAPDGFFDPPAPSFPDRKAFVRAVWDDEEADISEVLSVDGYETLRHVWHAEYLATIPSEGAPSVFAYAPSKIVPSPKTQSPWESLKKALWPSIAFVLGLFGARKILESWGRARRD